MTTRTTTPAPPPGVSAAAAGGTGAGRSGHPRGPGRHLELLVLAALAFVPLLVVDRGVVTSDTKTYLYLDPARFLGQVASQWYPTVALGTVTHQYVGYLFPMGPYYALAAAIHVPTWIAQRVWLGAILFAAGAGVVYLCRTLGVRRPGSLVAALAFMLSPYLLQYSGRISVILMPWAALPWLVAFTVRALGQRQRRMQHQRRGPAPGAGAGAGAAGLDAWRYPALFALVVALSSGINASSVLYVVLGPLLWLVWAVAVEREATWRDAGVVLLKLGALSVLVSAWWITGLLVEAGYGVDILRYTESVRATSSTSTPLEVLRGLGYWYFYGGGKDGPWTPSVVLYTKWLWLVALSYLLPLLSFVSAVLVRWRHRGYFVLLVVVGVVLSVGAYPYTSPPPAGAALKAFMNDTTAGLAMRSTDRATPLALLGLAVLLGAGVSALAAAWGRHPRAGWVAAAAVCALVVADNPAIFNGDATVVKSLTQPATLPSYDLAAARYLNSVRTGTRVLAVPGDSFAAYTWGETTDTPQPALLTRPFVTREQQVMGSIATADTLYAMDSPIQTHVQDWSALAPMARLLSAGDVLFEYDQTSGHYGSPNAVTLAETLKRVPAGLSDERAFGAPGQRVAKPTVDTELLAGTPHATKPPPVVDYRVRAPRPIVRAESDTGALVVAGDATGLDTLAAQGLLGTPSAIYYAGSLDGEPAALHALASHGATLVVTDTNRKQGFRWNGLGANAGQVQTARDVTTTRTPTDSPIDLFAKSSGATATTGSRTVAAYVGASDVTASSYGNPVTYAPEARPYSAIDGDVRTAWETGTFTSDVDGQWWQADFGHEVTAGHVTLVQPLFGTRERAISRVTLTFTGGRPVTVRLGAASHRRAGQQVDFSARTFRTLRVTIDATTKNSGTPVGFAEVEVPGQHVVEVDRMPTDLLSRLGKGSLADRLVLSMTRTRVSPYTTARTDPDMILARSFSLPTARTFALSGTATISPYLGDEQVDRIVGVPGATGSGLVATSSSRLTGALGDTASAAVDGDPSTLWQSGFGEHDVLGAWLQYRLHAPISFGRMSLTVVADRRHSAPSRIEVTATTAATGRTETRRAAVPFFLRSTVPGTTVSLPISFAPVRGTRVRVTFTGVREKRGTLADGKRTQVLPLGVAELGIPGLRAPARPAALPGNCQSDLLRIDGRPVTVRVVGPVAKALADGQVRLEPCGGSTDGIRLSAGRHLVESTLAIAPVSPGTTATVPRLPGWNVDELTLASAPGGAAAASLAPPVPGAVPRVLAHESSATSWALDVRHATNPFELVLGESLNAGWHAVATPASGARSSSHAVTLGAPRLVDGFANGWQVSRSDLRALGAPGGAGFTVTLEWTPQRWEWAGIAISGAAIVGCALLAFAPRRRRRGRARGARSSDPPEESEPREAESGPGWATGDASLALPGTDAAGRRVRWRTAVVVAAVVGALAAAITSPVGGVAVAVAVAAGLVFRPLRSVSAAAAVGLLAAAAAFVVVGQVVHPAAGGGNWPGAYRDAATLAAMAVAFLGADAVVDYARAPAPSDTA
jgi:arabinofuranan 3-O-arabinosyltransferase